MMSIAFAAPTGSALSAADSGPVVKAVLGILILMSVVTWAIVLYKTWRRKRIAGDDKKFLAVFYQSKQMNEIAKATRVHPLSGAARLFASVYDEIQGLRDHVKKGGTVGTDVLTRMTERTLDRSMLELRVDRERYLTFLASVASGAPFIGLFGTVWGIMNAFEGIGKTGSASLAVVAPGISEALIATAVGLFAAIPAALFYNFLQRRLEEEEASLAGYRLELLNLLEAFVFPELLRTQRGSEPGTQEKNDI